MNTIDPYLLMSTDFLINDYEDFVCMMIDYNNLANWESEDKWKWYQHFKLKMKNKALTKK